MVVRSLPDLVATTERLATIPGMVPSAFEFPEGCRFRDRCQLADGVCEEEPPLVEISAGHLAACHHIDANRAQNPGGAS